MNGIARTMFRTLWTVAFCGMIAFNVQAATVYDEAVQGDLSNNHVSPTSVSLGVGQNLISGSTVHTPSLDRDFFTITIGAGHTLDAIVLSSYTNTDDLSFFGMTTGSAFTGLGFSDVSSWALIGTHLIGNDLLTILTGGPLGPGAYSFWLQETEGITTYTLDYQVSAVPLPAALPLFLSGLLGLGAMARRRT
ncbi:MAG: VPLPA-CTERM sorting domain-containing protein [Nitrospira sp.]|nr:VPLPA-CTERM sorting domain-containing protein [Nitrospira sp.]MCP9443383.1 VPLPA-CTERM sorting domain-containing protein [Nitrospira sp.]